MEATLDFANELVADLADAAENLHLSDDLKARLTTTLASAQQARDFLAEAHSRAMIDRPFLWVRRVTNATASAMSAASSLTAIHNMIAEEKIDAKGRVKDLEVRCRELNARILAEPRPAVPGAGEQPLNALPSTAGDVLAPTAPVRAIEPEPVVPTVAVMSPLETVASAIAETAAPKVAGPIAPFATRVDTPIAPVKDAPAPVSEPPSVAAEIASEPAKFVAPLVADVLAPPSFTPLPPALPPATSIPDEPAPSFQPAPSISATNGSAPPSYSIEMLPNDAKDVFVHDAPIVRNPEPTTPDLRISLTGVEPVSQPVGNTVAVTEAPRPPLTLHEWSAEAINGTDEPIKADIGNVVQPKVKKPRVVLPRPVLVQPKPRTIFKVAVFGLLAILIALLVYRPILHKINLAKGDHLGARLVKINADIASKQVAITDTAKQIAAVQAKLAAADVHLTEVGAVLAPQQKTYSELADVQYRIAALSDENAKLLTEIKNPPSEVPHDEIWHIKMAKYQATEREISALSVQLSRLQDKAARLAPPTGATNDVSDAQQQVESLRGQIRKLQLDRQVLEAMVEQQTQYANQLRKERQEAYHPTSGL